MSELVLGGGFTSPYPLRLDPGASRAALPMAISLCLSRKSRSLGPQNAQNVGAKGGGTPPRVALAFSLSWRAKWHSHFAPGFDTPPAKDVLLSDSLFPLRDKEKTNLQRC